ncbi:MAG: zinc ABC transporter substrate-binding protein, partial [Opitutaceae bacterium]|nr:zinc ABC transporter substrate-binding protein [Opitutaceae bacterium]
AALAALLPDQAGALAARAAACEEELRGLDRFARGRLADIPPRHRVLVTTHDSLAHLARAYGLRVLPLSGADGHAEPSARQVAAVINALRADKIPAVFMDTTASPRLAALVARETGARLAPPLCADTLPEGGTYAETFRQNIRIIAGALRGDGG